MIQVSHAVGPAGEGVSEADVAAVTDELVDGGGGEGQDEGEEGVGQVPGQTQHLAKQTHPGPQLRLPVLKQAPRSSTGGRYY